MFDFFIDVFKGEEKIVINFVKVYFRNVIENGKSEDCMLLFLLYIFDNFVELCKFWL